MGFGLQPFADIPGAALTIGRPVLREAVVDHVVALDSERVLDELAAWPASSQAIACWRRLAVMRLLLANDLDGVLPEELSGEGARLPQGAWELVVRPLVRLNRAKGARYPSATHDLLTGSWRCEISRRDGHKCGDSGSFSR